MINLTKSVKAKETIKKKRGAGERMKTQEKGKNESQLEIPQ